MKSLLHFALRGGESGKVIVPGSSATNKLTFYHNGINRRLTDVHGHVIKGILA